MLFNYSSIFGRPAPGYRDRGEGALWSVGSHGYSWAAGVSGIYGMRMRFDMTNTGPHTTTDRGYCLQLRCLSE
ncbi:hypothetical protein [uncultured Rikenella sp.]|uniref:hypothetical protein n=1 Tax=uncultured Rikenella sp. TaxID=368003 RepID=UPI00261491E0|nr:hypothetical protein [uncultured Rikenella sp.]